ncbi:MAG: response regulator [Candidatus Cloacimonetes bacterium]|nr:response regulator [Candidatus Cloacimonadota bacterium]MBS3767144.1 response regulator [Candidatus Cloacimonadota bacterium]
MKKISMIILAEDDEGHASLIKKNLRRAGIKNKIIRFKDGQSALDYILNLKKNIKQKSDLSVVLLLDIRMPYISGIEILRKIKQDRVLKDIYTVIVTTTDDPAEIKKCYGLGCNAYVTKPVIYEQFIKTFYHLGIYLLNLNLPNLEND